MIVGFTGTQHGLTFPQRESLRKHLQALAVREFHHGDCIGADATAHMFVRPMGARIYVHPSTKVEKRAYCKGATHVYPPKSPLERNPDIVRPVDRMIACPKNQFMEYRSGTWATVRFAWKCSKPVDIVWPDGTVLAGVVDPSGLPND